MEASENVPVDQSTESFSVGHNLHPNQLMADNYNVGIPGTDTTKKVLYKMQIDKNSRGPHMQAVSFKKDPKVFKKSIVT
jgi:hypothetical protein